jgi:hypothetical protein
LSSATAPTGEEWQLRLIAPGHDGAALVLRVTGADTALRSKTAAIDERDACPQQSYDGG